MATGRSDYPNQVNNSLAFPGVFRGALDVKARSIDDAMKIAAARYRRAGRCLRALARFPDPRQPRSPRRTRVAAAVAEAAISGDLAHNPLDPREVEMRCRDLVYEGTVGL